MRAKIREYVIAHLRNGTACANTFYREGRPSARNRISELRADGWTIETVRCDLHSHDSNVVQYRLLGEPGDQGQLQLGGTK